MASTTWNNPFKMSKAERDHLNAKREKKDVESRLDQLEFDINVIKSAVLNLAGETNKDPLEYLDEVAKQTSCDNVIKHHTDMLADTVRKVNSMLSRKDMIEMILKIDVLEDDEESVVDVFQDNMYMERINDKGKDLFELFINYSSEDNRSCAVVVLGHDAKDKLSLELYGPECRNYLCNETWLNNLENTILLRGIDYKSIYVSLNIRKLRSNYTVQGDIDLYDQNGNLVATAHIPVRNITDNFCIKWKGKDMLKTYCGKSSKQ